MDEFSASGPAVSEMNTLEAKRGMMEILADSAANALYDKSIRIAVPFSYKFHLHQNGLMEEFITLLTQRIGGMSQFSVAYLRYVV
jgi:hypothetical protein